MKIHKEKTKQKGMLGITLIALVITVIVLLLLAGVSITMLTGNNSLPNKAVEAKEKTEKASKEEQRQLAQMEANMNTEETEYLGVKIPAGYAPTKIEGENTLEDGLVITDGAGNEYVWIEVPNDGSGPDYTAYKTSNNVTDIEEALHTYTSTYRNGTSYNDNYDTTEDLDDSKVQEATNLTKQKYKELKEKMLKSIYENGGFYIGRYETGIESKKDARKTPIIKENAYPYNYVTCKQSQQLANKFDPSGEKYTASLMFGVQWDLVMKYLETKGTTQDDLKLDSKNWGNYKDKTYIIQDKDVKYSSDYGASWKSAPYNKSSSDGVLLTTGASDEFKKQNIYDVAGNVREWTLEYTSNADSPCVNRSGDFNNFGHGMSASIRSTSGTNGSVNYIGFRVSLY